MNPSHRLRLIALLPLATGAGLLGFLIARISIWIGFGLVAVLGLAVIAAVWRSATTVQRATILRRARAGLIAGIAATAAYDLSRFILVTVFESPVWPFEALPAFGGLLLGADAGFNTRLFAGSIYHVINGVGFGIAYALFSRRPRILTGLVWALVLELFMVTLYPTWINLKALDEFVRISAFGHVVYGVVLGLLTRRFSFSDPSEGTNSYAKSSDI